ncbi:RNA-binding S4 domain-containing protein [Uliginosibacterium sp. 31-16]|uniref:RNA-binding S4 domain-containing protein n=1 Tax=Uliginosibacterium sp. 31-16 TaxID=3068315 RepID=UPI0027402D02|nr:RNA-binding S4 domain-containing protein [Uliginosibacterium sp. 31-16]MDP5239017.1 RNA-binding S4 domain-containing protein [Uliginosibacterium sp. 31-16]
MVTELSAVRIDKWLWAARFFKTRSLATDAVDGGRVQVNGLRVKPAKDVKIGDRVELSIGDLHWELVVEGLSEKRGPAPEARKLYAETEASQARRAKQLDERHLRVEPAADIHGRPTKRDRRSMDRWRGG